MIVNVLSMPLRRRGTFSVAPSPLRLHLRRSKIFVPEGAFGEEIWRFPKVEKEIKS